jgi:tetratricopeptide (TPR) repeat protein
MADLAAIKRTVAELEAKGDVDKAISELEKAIPEFPREGPLFNKLGDLLIKVNRQREALDVYERGARVLMEETYYPNAIALCKKILRLDKDRLEVYGMLGELHKELGQLVEAANYLLEYADRKMKANEIEPALKTYEVIKDLVPNNYKILQTISVIFEKFGKKEHGEELRKEAQEIETKQKELKDQFASQPAVDEIPIAVEMPAVEPESPVEVPVKEEPRPGPEPSPDKEITLDDFVSPEVAELLKDQPRTDEVVLEERKETVETGEKGRDMSEIDRTVELGDVYLNLGEEEEAIDCFRDAALLAYKDKQYDQAISLNRRIADLRPLDLKCRQYLVEVSKIKGDKDLQVNAMIELAEALNRREAKTEAQSIFRKILEMDPENVTALKMVEEITQPKDFIDLGAVLRTELEGEKKMEGLSNINELISQFRKEVFESIGEGDYRSHYDLGVAYKGMGLFQEAIEEFEIASKDIDLKLKACEMIGSCLIDKGKVDEALKVLSAGLLIQNRPASEYFGIHFLLGNAYENQNNLSMAIKSYMNAANIDKTVPDLVKKINFLKEKLTEELKKRGKPVPPSKKATAEKPAAEPPKQAPAEKVPPKKSKVTYL